MKTGDIVRFAKWEDIMDIDDWSTTPKKHVGLLISYDKLMKLALVLHNCELLKIRGQLIEKAGKLINTPTKKEAYRA